MKLSLFVRAEAWKFFTYRFPWYSMTISPVYLMDA